MTKKSQKRKVCLLSDNKSSENDCNKQKALSKTNAKGKKTVNNQRKERNESKNSEDTDSDLEIYNKCTEIEGKRRGKLKSIKQILATEEEGESSSSKEFQKSKLYRHCYVVLKKCCESKGIHSKSTKSHFTSTKHREENTMISEEQSLNFKSRVIKILNRFKDVCSEYELHMEHVKCKHFKKKLMYQESVKNVINKSKDVIVRLRTELDTQEKELTDFYNEWHKNCNLQNISDEDSSTSERKVWQGLRGLATLDTSKWKSSTEKENVVSDCEIKKIFSEDESSETNVKENKKDKDLPLGETEKVVKDDNNEDVPSAEDNAVASPILGKNKKKKISNKVHSKGKSGKIGTRERDSTESQRDENEHDKNDSSEDMFESSFAENIEATDTSKVNDDELEEENNLASKKVQKINNESESANSDSKIKENLVKNEELIIEPDNEDLNMNEGKSVTPQTVISPKVELMSNTESSVTARIKRTDDNCSDISNEEEKSKKALLDSDSDISTNEESLSEKSNRESITDKPLKKYASKLKPVKCNGKKQEDKENTHSACGGRLLEEQDRAKKAERRVKRSLRESNSNGSATVSAMKCTTSDEKHESDNHSEDERSKAKLLDSSNSESSNSEKDKKGSSIDDTVPVLDVSVSERVKNRRIDLKKICDSQSDEKLKTDCHVGVERLPKEDLKKYANALRKSQEYLEDKKFKSLIDLDRLAKCHSRANDSTQSSMPKKKTKAAKEEEDSLLNHLKKVENGEFDENLERDSGSENINAIAEPQIAISTNEELMMEADRIVKEMLLNSDSDSGEQKSASESSNSEPEKSNAKVKDDTKKSVPKQGKKNNSSASDKAKNDKDNDEREKSGWRRHKLLTMKFSSESDSDVQRKKWDEKNKKLQEQADGSDKENLDANETGVKRKKRTRRKILNFDSYTEMLNSDSDSDKSVIMKDEEDSSDSAAGKKKRRKRKTRKSCETDSSATEKRPKSKRRRIKNMGTDSEGSDDNGQITNSQGTPGKKGRKNIRKMIKDKQVADDTKQAAKEEEERIQRISERQKLYNEMYEARLAGEEKVENLVLDFNLETKEELISVHPDLVKRLKPHQAKGIKFMWDACFESLEMLKTSSGSGCIIAHCMGLGKTLQVIVLVHTLLRHEETGVKTIMIVSPLSTVLNWVNEFKLWLKDVEDGKIKVYELTKFKKNVERRYQLMRWQNTGGVLIIGYEMFRNLSRTNNKMRKNMKEAILQYLIDPGPDMVICDEGHLLKNEDTALSKSMTRIKTLRRIILTGTPLQNNLAEYHCMVQFIKPSLLGTKREFLNRFVNPITNGQFDDSTENDVKLMKKRAYVLHKMLKGCVQRFDYSVLTPFLPPKQEYVIFVRLTEVQINMYRHYLDNIARQQRAANGALFADYQALQRIWTHPLVLRLKAESMAKINEMKSSSRDDSEGSLRDFVQDSDTQSTGNLRNSSAGNSSDDDDIKIVESVSKKTTKGNNNADVEVSSKPEENEKKENEEWWLQFTQPEHFKDLRMSAKLMLLFGILKECEQIGDKVLIFSQSLYSLTLIEKFLETIDNETRHGENSEFVDGYTGSWTLGLDYFRLDGKTTADNRNKFCRIFNRPTNTRARLFLISTRAGGLGINLTAANRVIIFDASWNPSHDVQSIFRVYRFGQKKPCYIYRFLAAGTMEEKIYNRQVTKLSLSCRVVDEQQIGRHYSNHDLNELYNFDLYTNASGERPTLNLPKDRLLAEIFLKYKNSVQNYHEHDSLLENKAEEELDEEERKLAWLEYEEEKKGKPMIAPYPTMYPAASNLIRNQYNLPIPLNMATDYQKLQELIRQDYPNSTPEAQQIMTTRVLSDMYSYWEQQTYHNTANRLPTQNAGIIQPATGAQVPNLARMLQVTQNTNVASGQARNELPYNYKNITQSNDRDDDIEEIPPPAVANKSKAQEE